MWPHARNIRSRSRTVPKTATASSSSSSTASVHEKHSTGQQLCMITVYIVIDFSGIEVSPRKPWRYLLRRYIISILDAPLRIVARNLINICYAPCARRVDTVPLNTQYVHWLFHWLRPYPENFRLPVGGIRDKQRLYTLCVLRHIP